MSNVDDAIQVQLAMANIYRTIGERHSDQGEYQKAVDYYMKELEFQERILGKEHIEVDLTCIRIAGEYIKMQEEEQAVEFLYHHAGIKNHF